MITMKVVLACLALLGLVEGQVCGEKRELLDFVSATNGCYINDACLNSALLEVGIQMQTEAYLTQGSVRHLDEYRNGQRQLTCNASCMAEPMCKLMFCRRRLEGEEVEDKAVNEEPRSLRGVKETPRRLNRPPTVNEDWLSEAGWDLVPALELHLFKEALDARLVDNLGFVEAEQIMYYLQIYNGPECP